MVSGAVGFLQKSFHDESLLDLIKAEINGNGGG